MVLSLSATFLFLPAPLLISAGPDMCMIGKERTRNFLELPPAFSPSHLCPLSSVLRSLLLSTVVRVVHLKISAGPLDGVDHWGHLVSAETAAEDDNPRQELLYNFDPYVLGANDDGS